MYGPPLFCKRKMKWASWTAQMQSGELKMSDNASSSSQQTSNLTGMGS
jgi:hypothetical protein